MQIIEGYRSWNVELHGSIVEVDSLREGQGATFTVRLPLLRPKASVNEQKRQV
ncbi:MAG: hypothetical protein F6K28_49190 [Microcoleus sp. SIO2G3]|nr:hypothetical protein [Microcoleus sp. SIO2G3]